MIKAYVLLEISLGNTIRQTLVSVQEHSWRTLSFLSCDSGRRRIVAVALLHTSLSLQHTFVLYCTEHLIYLNQNWKVNYNFFYYFWKLIHLISLMKLFWKSLPSKVSQANRIVTQQEQWFAHLHTSLSGNVGGTSILCPVRINVIYPLRKHGTWSPMLNTEFALITTFAGW